MVFCAVTEKQCQLFSTSLFPPDLTSLQPLSPTADEVVSTAPAVSLAIIDCIRLTSGMCCNIEHKSCWIDKTHVAMVKQLDMKLAEKDLKT